MSQLEAVIPPSTDQPSPPAEPSGPEQDRRVPDVHVPRLLTRIPIRNEEVMKDESYSQKPMKIGDLT
jgi:hypothetical protein